MSRAAKRDHGSSSIFDPTLWLARIIFSAGSNADVNLVTDLLVLSDFTGHNLMVEKGRKLSEK